MRFSFTVQGEPVPKQRARKGKDGRFYTPEKTRRYEKLVGDIARWSLPRGWPLDGAYKLTVNLFLSDWRKRDYDNVLKALADAMNEVAYADDSQITHHGEGAKHFGDPNPRAEVTLEYLGPMPSRPGRKPRAKAPRIPSLPGLGKHPPWLAQMIANSAAKANNPRARTRKTLAAS